MHNISSKEARFISVLLYGGRGKTIKFTNKNKNSLTVQNRPIVSTCHRLHSKNTRVSVTRKRVHWGFGAKLHSGSTMTQKSVNLKRIMTQSWVNLTPLFVSLTDFRVIIDPVSSEIYAVAKFMTSAKFMTLTLTLSLIDDPNPNPIPCEILDVEILDACADSPIVINFASHKFRATPEWSLAPMDSFPGHG